MTDMIIPYNFVPLSKWVFSPSWAYNVSHDVPFKDSLSGIIEYTLTNKTYLSVGSYKEEGSKIVTFESTPDNEHLVIPGTSIKGMLREVLSIASFGKFEQFYDKRHSYRDITTTKTDYYKDYEQYKIKPLWVKFNVTKSKWEYRICEWAKAFHPDLNNDLKLSTKIVNWHNVESHNNNMTAKDKYEIIGLNQKLFANLEPVESKSGKNYKKAKNFEKSSNDSSKTEGYMVFGGPRVVNPDESKWGFYDYSYFYYDVKKPSIIEDEKIIEQLFENNNKEKTPQKNLLQYLKENQNPEYGIPLWGLFINNSLKMLGTSRMPRIVCRKSIKDIVSSQSPSSFYSPIFDLPELLFGAIRDDASHASIKSRIGFGDLYSLSLKQNDLITMDHMVLAEPKSSFHEAYLTNYPETMTYSSEKSQISGWKRYPIKEKFYYINETKDNKDSKGNENTECTVKFAPENSSFKGKIIFHNLKKFELGALLWVLNFGNRKNCCHSLGYAKPFGAGAINITVDKIVYPKYIDESIDDLNEYMKVYQDLFEQEMEQHYKKVFGETKSWLLSPQLSCLFDFAGYFGYRKNTAQNVYNNLSDFSKLRKDKVRIQNKIKDIHSNSIDRISDPKDDDSAIPIIDINNKVYSILSETKSSVNNSYVSTLKRVYNKNKENELGAVQSPAWRTHKKMLESLSGFYDEDSENQGTKDKIKLAYTEFFTKWHVPEDECNDSEIWRLYFNFVKKYDLNSKDSFLRNPSKKKKALMKTDPKLKSEFEIFKSNLSALMEKF